MSQKKPSWHSIEPQQEIITFNDRNYNTVVFLDEGIEGTATVKDKSGKAKDVKQVSFQVLDTNDKMKEKGLNIISKRFIDALKALYPLTNWIVEMERVGFGFNTQYKCTKVKEYKPSK